MTTSELITILQGIEADKPWEYQIDNNTWGSPPEHVTPQWCLRRGVMFRLKPWSLPAPPEDREWHRTDWTEEMLPSPYRPMLLNEVREPGDEYWSSEDRWDKTPEKGLLLLRGYNMFFRTTRPLPPARRKVPLEFQDIVPGACIRRAAGRWYQIAECHGTGVCAHCGFISFITLKAEDWQILKPGSSVWENCHKLI